MNDQKLYQKSMKYDGETIYKHEIDMLICFLMVPGSQNHNFDEFLKVYLERKKTTAIAKKAAKNKVVNLKSIS